MRRIKMMFYSNECATFEILLNIIHELFVLTLTSPVQKEQFQEQLSLLKVEYQV